MLQAMAVLLRKRAELTRELEAGIRRAIDVENELRALDRAITSMRHGQRPSTRKPTNSH